MELAVERAGVASRVWLPELPACLDSDHRLLKTSHLLPLSCLDFLIHDFCF